MTSPARRARILVVEDDPDQFDALALALDSAGYLVEHARDGREALAVLQRFQPDMVLTDLVMPGMSGEELVRHIRASGGTQPRVLVVSGMNGLRGRCSQLGADGCLGKPFELDELLGSVGRMLASPPAAPGSTGER